MDEMALRTLEKLAETLREAQVAYEAACLDAEQAECVLELEQEQSSSMERLRYEAHTVQVAAVCALARAQERVLAMDRRRYDAQKALLAAAGLRDATWR